MLRLDFTDDLIAQDMIGIVMRKKGLTEEEAVVASINQAMYRNVITKKYVSIAFNLWGHAEFDREWYTLENPVVEVGLDGEKLKLVTDVAERENVDMQRAVCYFLVFMMESLGYHI